MADSVIQALTGKMVEYSVDALKKQLNYLCFYSSNVQTLAEALEELKNRHQSVQQKVDVARANSEVITPEVEAWLRSVEELKIRCDEILRHNEEILRSRVRKWIPQLQYSLGRKARKAARDCVELRNTTFDTISNPVIPADLSPVPNPSYLGFESRKDVEDKILYALNDPNVYSIGIWGVGGVGKTEMAKNIERKVRNEKTLFEHVVVVVVSQQLDLPKLQSQIANALNLPLDEESLDLRQKKLHHKLMAENSILIILDDLWERLDLEALGIPSQSKKCKLILTSRDEDALTSTGVQNMFQLKILTKEESWRFFRDNAGINEDDSRDELVVIARKVERECKGLPLALKIVACALKGKEKYFWDNALEELKKSAPNNITGVLKGVYQPLKYSFKVLESKEQKDLFLLCCLFPEDYCISDEELLRFGIGLRIFNPLNSLTGYRNKVKSVLDILLRLSLLITEKNEYSENFEVRMHDVIRDVGIWIATEEGMTGSNGEKQQFMIEHGLNECPSMTKEHSPSINNCTFISLHFSHSSITFPKSIVYTKLELLRLDVVRRFPKPSEHRLELSENFFNGMGEIKVLEALRIKLLPPSISELNSLRTLLLKECNISQTVSMLGKLITLEILSLEWCKFLMLPIDIGRLKNLKQLKILDDDREGRIAVGVISKLTRLEELVILGFFDNWEAEARLGGDEDGNACFRELDSLKKLTTLKIEIKNPRVIPREKPQWVQNLESYNIAVRRFHSGIGFEKSISLGKEVVNPLGNWVYDMASDAEYLNLEGSNCMIVVKLLSQNSGNLSCLKQLRLAEFTDIRYLVECGQNGAVFPMLEYLDISDSDSLQQISEVLLSIGSFVKLHSIILKKLSGLVCLWKVSINEQLCLKSLQRISISRCDNLSSMFSLSVVQSLVQLSSLDVTYCKTVEEIFKKNDGELVEKIELPKLNSLYFEDLESLCNFCNGIDRIELPQLMYLYLDKLLNMKMTKSDNNEIHQQYFIQQVAGMNFNFCGLTNLVVDGFGNFKCMFSPLTISGVPNLRSLTVSNCSMLEQVIGKDDENVGQTISFPNLRSIKLRYLPNILTFCCNAIKLPWLHYLDIMMCPKMLKFVEEPPNNHISNSTLSLDEQVSLSISNSTLFLDEQVYCPKLKALNLHRLSISSVFSPLTFKTLTHLDSLRVLDCKELEHIIIKEEEGEIKCESVPLNCLFLINLPKLCGSIFEMKHPLEFPSLDVISIEDCPMLAKFSLGSVHMPNLKIVSGFLKTAIVSSIKEISSLEIGSEKNYFIISLKDIFFSSDCSQDMKLYFLPIGSSQSFANVVFFEESTKIVGKFMTERIQIGIEYEIMLMIMLDGFCKKSEDLVEIELKIPGESELQQRTEILNNQAREIWTEIFIGKFTMREPQQIGEELEFSLRNLDPYLKLWVKGVRIVEA